MAVTSGTVNTNTYSKSHFYVNWQQVSQDIGGNFTRINWQAGLYTGTSSSHDSWGSNAIKIYSVYINGTLVSNGGTWSNKKTGGSFELLSGTFDVYHNGDGTKSFDISISAWLYSNHNLSGNGSFELNTIPRYANLTQFDVYAINETTIRFAWNADANCDAVQYSIDGSGWIGGYHPTTDIGGLSANTQHSVRIRIKRSDSQLWTESGYGYATTYDYPHVISADNFVIGNNINLNLYNPLGRNLDIYIIGNDNSTICSASRTTNGTTSISNTQSEINAQYNSIPNSKQGNYSVRLVVNALGRDTTVNGGTYSIDNSDNKCNPTFDTTNWSYIADLTNLTNNNQIVINNQSTITFTVNTPAVAKLGASIREYQYKWGNKTNAANSTDVIKGSGSTIEVIAVDTRGYSTSSSIDLGDNLVNYISPTVQNFDTHRENGVEADTTLNLNGQLFNNTFGANGVQNELISAKYYVSTNNQTFSQGYDINLNNFTLNNDYYSLSNYQIHEDGTSGGFPVGTRYYLKVELTDKVSTLTITNILVTDGKLAFDTYQDNNGDYHIGLNGLANSNYALNVNGKINGDISDLIYTSNLTLIYYGTFTPSDLIFISTSVDINGYTPLGIIGYKTPDHSTDYYKNTIVHDISISNNQLNCYLKTLYTSSVPRQFKLTVTILYLKTQI